MPEARNENDSAKLIADQRLITACALDIIKAVKQRRGKPLQPRDRMALKLLTPRNSALVVAGGVRNLGCRQVTFDILTDDLGRGSHRLTPAGVHVLNAETGWWSDRYGGPQFLWNLYLKEDPEKGMARILERLFKFKLSGLFGPKADLSVTEHCKTIAGNIDRGLKLYIQREEGTIETSLRRLTKAGAIYSPTDLGLIMPHNDKGYVALLFGKNRRYAITFSIERL